MWNRKRPEIELPPQKAPRADQVTFEQPRKPSVLELLKKRRAEKIEARKKLDKEIELLDHDLTFIELHPNAGRILEFISSRFRDEVE